MSAKEPDAVDVLVGHNIRIYRNARRISQTALAERLGVRFQKVQEYERGTSRVGAGRLAQVAAALDVPVTALLDGVAEAHGRADVDGGECARQAASSLSPIAQRERYQLMQAFARLHGRRVRRAVLALVEEIARGRSR